MAVKPKKKVATSKKAATIKVPYVVANIMGANWLMHMKTQGEGDNVIVELNCVFRDSFVYLAIKPQMLNSESIMILKPGDRLVSDLPGLGDLPFTYNGEDFVDDRGVTLLPGQFTNIRLAA